MDFKNFNEIFNTDFNLNNILAVRQSWRPEKKFNCIETTRRDLGLLMITDYPARFVYPDGESMQANAGDVVLLPKGARYTLNFLIPPGEMAHPLVVNFEMTAADGSAVNYDGNAMRLCRDSLGLQALFNTAAQHYRSSAYARLKGTVFELLGRLFPMEQEDECCVAYINRNYTEKFKIPELARACGMSDTFYRKRFKELTGLSPVQYINRMKVTKACQLLMYSDMKPASISEFLNFYSLPYFYKVFRSVVGMTPGEYLEQQEKNTHP